MNIANEIVDMAGAALHKAFGIDYPEKPELEGLIVQMAEQQKLLAVTLVSHHIESGLKKTRPFRFLLPKSVVLDWFMVNSCLFWWSFTCQTLAVNARNCAKTTKSKSDAL